MRRAAYGALLLLLGVAAEGVALGTARHRAPGPGAAAARSGSGAAPPQALALAAAPSPLARRAIQVVPGRRRGRGRQPTIPEDDDQLNASYDGRFHFVRVRYTPWREGMRCVQGGGPAWAHDYPRGERNFLKILNEVTYIHPLLEGSNVLALDDPRIFEYPIAYIIEVAAWYPTENEVESLREYLLKGGFLIVDDFRYACALDNLKFQLDRVLPGAQLIQLDASHPIFDSFFRVDPKEVIPPYGPRDPVWYGVFEDNDRSKRLLAIINYDNDISEYWEFSDLGYYAIDLSNEAYKLGVNYIVYGMTH